MLSAAGSSARPCSLSPFALGGLGAGDVKLLAALGTWFGVTDDDLAWAFTPASPAGSSRSPSRSRRGYMRQALSNVWLLLTHWRVAGLRALPELTIHQGKRS